MRDETHVLQRVGLQDVAALLVSVILAAGVVYLSAAQIAIPGTITAALIASIGWLFTRAAQAHDIVKIEKTNGYHVAVVTPVEPLSDATNTARPPGG